MIPLRLELSNFLSYRETTALEFEGIHLACISGLNGAGKSSLLDAMTWSLFGKSRSRSDDDVVNRLAAREGKAAEVRFVFDLEGTEYRVLRQKQQGRTSVLEFQLCAGDGEWRTLSEGGVRQTQEAIENLLRMNFDTFTNASFFLQGQADEFTTKTPGQRKQILADLLGVNRWDRYKEEAARKRKEEEDKLLVLDARLAEIDDELGQQEEREAELAQARAELAQIGERLAEKEKLQEQMRRVVSAMQQQKQQVQNLREALTRAETRLERLHEKEAQRRQERAQFQELLDDAAAIQAAHAAWQEAQETLNGWQQKADAYNRLQRERRPHELALERARTALEEQVKELQKQGQAAAEMREERTQVEQSLETSRQRVQELEGEREKLAQTEEAWHEARSALQRLQDRREMQQKELEKLKAEAQRMERQRQELAAVEKNLAQATETLAKAEEEVTTLEKKHERYVQAMAERDGLQSQQQRLRESMDKLAERRQTLEAETGGACPLCGQPLTDEHRETVLAEVLSEGKTQADQFRANKQTIEALSDEIDTLGETVPDRDRLQREVQTQRQRQAAAQARLDEIERALEAWQDEGPPRIAALQEQLEDDQALNEKQSEVTELGQEVKRKKEIEEALREEQKKLSAAQARRTEIRRAIDAWETKGQEALAQAEQKLEEGDFALEARSSLLDVDERMADVGYDEEAHAAARQSYEELAEAPARYQELKQAEAAVKPLEDTLSDLAQQIEEQEEAVADATEQHREAAAQLEALDADEDQLREVEDAVASLREKEVEGNRKVGAAQQRLAVLDDLRQQQEKETERRAEFTRLIERLQRLEKACGRDGVQALLIEQALPEIEEDANELLERLTGGAMRVTFETQRELKSRDALAETLDIHISDAAGRRPYENFSGGEQFRVNFAIRLALSRILAKRAGARLQTLVIDEGFGSQDPEGRQRLVEAINTIRDDFACILVITHISELRDAFSTRIEVEKTSKGSQITVI